MNGKLLIAALAGLAGFPGTDPGPMRIRGVHRVPAESEAGRRFVTSLNAGHQSTGHEERPGCKAAQRRLRQLERQQAKAQRKA